MREAQLTLTRLQERDVVKIKTDVFLILQVYDGSEWFGFSEKSLVCRFLCQ